MKVQWHEFKNEMPEEARELWVWRLRWTSPERKGLTYREGWGWRGAYDDKTWHLDSEGRMPTHWAYFDRPEPPES